MYDQRIRICLHLSRKRRPRTLRRLVTAPAREPARLYTQLPTQKSTRVPTRLYTRLLPEIISRFHRRFLVIRTLPLERTSRRTS